MGDRSTSADAVPPPWLTGKFRSRLIAFVSRARPRTPATDIEDALQDVLLRIHRKLSTDAPPDSPRNWDRYMYQAVTNRLNDLHEVARRHAPLDEDALAERAGDPGERPDVSVDTAERAALFHALIRLIRGDAGAEEHPAGLAFAAVQKELRARLTDRHWIVLRMHGLDGIGFQEIARALGVSVGSAHGWYRGALDICGAVLARYENLESL